MNKLIKLIKGEIRQEDVIDIVFNGLEYVVKFFGNKEDYNVTIHHETQWGECVSIRTGQMNYSSGGWNDYDQCYIINAQANALLLAREIVLRLT